MILLDSLLVAAAWLLAASGRRRGIRRSVAAAGAVFTAKEAGEGTGLGLSDAQPVEISADSGITDTQTAPRTSAAVASAAQPRRQPAIRIAVRRGVRARSSVENLHGGLHAAQLP